MNRIVTAILLVFLPLVILGVSWVVTPGYFNSMLQAEAPRQMLIIFFVLSLGWLALGGFLSLFLNGLLRALIPLFFTIPVTVSYMLCPALITIVTAIGPVVK